MKPIVKNIRRLIIRERAIAAIAVIVMTLAGLGVFEYLRCDVVISCGVEEQIALKTMKTTVKEALDEAGVEVVPEDYVSVPLDSKLLKTKTNNIQIKKAVPIYVEVDGQEVELMSYKETVAEALADNSISLFEQDKLLYASLDDKIEENMKLKIVRINVEEVSEQTPIPYQVVTRENSNLDKGKENVVRQGEEGIEEKTYKVVYEDGKEIKRELLSQRILSTPIDRIVEIGTMLTYKTARGEDFRYSKVLDMRATAYTASFKDTGKHPDHPHFGITYTGIRARRGIIAVDPKVIPLGTKVYVEGVGNTPDYGFALAADIGGAIKGDLIDLYFDEQETVDAWGVKKVRVYILED